MKYFSMLFLLCFLALSSCTNIKKVVKEPAKLNPLAWKQDLKAISLSANIRSDYHGETNSGRIKMWIAGTDSISMTLFGPLNITLGKLYARSDYFIFYNVFNNEVLEGVPSAQNLKQAAMIPLSFEQIVRLLRCETPGNPELFTLTEKKENGTHIYKNSSVNKNYIETISLKSSNNQIENYYNTLITGNSILELTYSDYDNFGGFNLAQTLSFKFPEINSSLIIDINDLEINKNINKEFTFKIPDKIKRIKLD